MSDSMPNFVVNSVQGRLRIASLQLREGLIACVLLLVVIASAPFAQATDAEASQTVEGEAEESSIVIRISKELFHDLMRHEVEMTVPIHTRVEGLLLTGSATGQGTTAAEFISSDDRAEVVISMNGTAVGTIRSDVGPAIVQMSSRSQLASQARLIFDGRDFSVAPATTDARNRSKIDCIRAKRRGPVGKLVEHIGRRIAQKSMPEMNAEAQQMTAQIVTDKFDERAEALVNNLNATTQTDELVFKHFPELAEWKFRTAARTDFLAAGLGPPSASIPAFLLEEHNIDAHIELWMKLTPGQAAMLELIGEFDIVYDVLRDTVGDEEADKLKDDITLDRQDGWSVIRAGTSKAH